ncbi:RdgB/HAM1 family non-canonical purine NTP pyrophosphatase [Pseudohongiella sp.]|uniref:dITP/XTP pyrophosphatase n=1 Tax=marine sediment metagenome TaxID=412755 RepID=A0A0F9XJ01_9ZZZZ|nr:RdgB/HAM1 family non-canonical purine NTP pyrophosphatase [Pseudohongiella sp.]HDZ08817.1 RdgB/HAM1 family non-canonical purine NTP pyrophosphatase [Pseudohongiella sp.]HEA62433.1 RdgB/HAM1 family non-canonical purine NTP pyrophosphatase [Pseudohongiella sp.]
MSKRIVLASGNAGKLRELQQLLQPLHVELVTQQSLGIGDADETGLTFIENAILKARHASDASSLPALADDSGLSVDALGGAPGIYSARFADMTGDCPADADRGTRDAANNRKLLGLLEGLPEDKRSAQFHCVLVYLRHAADPTPIVCHGVWHGRILPAPTGEGGFGYDPLFHVPSMACSSAQLSAEQKNAISHRAIAMQSLIQQLQTHL